MWLGTSSPARSQAPGQWDASSGNYGYALACIGRDLGLPVTIVTSASISGYNASGIRKAGATLVMTEPEPGESSNHARMRVAGEIAAREGRLFLDQYRNPLNPECHQRWTAPELMRDGPFDACFMAASSGGTARGFMDYLASEGDETTLVLVEPDASCAFVAPPAAHDGKLTIPGYGSGRRSTFSGGVAAPDIVRVHDADVLSAATDLAARGFARIGLSSTGVLLGTIRWLGAAKRPMRVACICADGAERYDDEMASRYLPAHENARLRASSGTVLEELAGLTRPDNRRPL